MIEDGKVVLIVEDDTDARESLAALLETEGYRVLEAAEGGEALEVLRSAPVGIILLDIFMPGMNGCAFMNEQSADPVLASIPVVVITADAAAARKASRRGIEAAMTKPVDHDRLLEIVGRHF
jgi:CheY-like chemotaxis protein